MLPPTGIRVVGFELPPRGQWRAALLARIHHLHFRLAHGPTLPANRREWANIAKHNAGRVCLDVQKREGIAIGFDCPSYRSAPLAGGVRIFRRQIRVCKRAGKAFSANAPFRPADPSLPDYQRDVRFTVKGLFQPKMAALPQGTNPSLSCQGPLAALSLL